MEEDCIKLEASWKQLLIDEFKSPYMQELKNFLKAEIAQQKTIFPKGNEYFAALNLTAFDQVKVVILGQDPYHGPGQAHGLCFSVRPGVTPPPSLVNIFKEMKTDIGFEIPRHGCLESWSKQGVLLLNSVLTVESGTPGSHQGRGWEIFTDAIVRNLNDKRDGLVFILWGAYAGAKGKMIDAGRHLVLKAAHPSPFSAYKGFFGCRHFSKANDYLQRTGRGAINWSLPLSYENSRSSSLEGIS